MSIATKVLVTLLALEHLYILYFEMFCWMSAKALKTFGMTAETAAQTKRMAGNQGLYNGFLAAGLIWSLFAGPELALPLARFFFACILVAGLYGGATVTPRIYFVQFLPAAIALILSFLG